MYTSMEELLSLCEARNVPLWQIVLEGEMELTEKPAAEIWQKLGERYEIMRRSTAGALERPLSSAGGLIDGIAARQSAHAADKNSIAGPFLNRLMARALSASEVNASMGRICAAPTAGACGILPAVLETVGERYNLPKRTVLEALLTATGVGAIVMRNATVAGSEAGCQAECGVAAAMSAAAAAQMAGGTNAMIADAFSLALMNCMGLICDPIAGLVQVPCAQRNASQAVNAVLSADMALAGNKSPIPADEMIEAMYEVGQMLPRALRETAQGGIAASPTGRRIAKEIYGGD